MNDFLINHELAVRLGAFLGIFAIMAAWELLAPRRQLLVAKSQRWIANLSLVVLNSLLLRLLFPVAAVGVAGFTTSQGWGLFHLIELPFWLEVLLCVVLLDLVIYLQHVMVHAIPTLWRLHRVHHADLDYDLTTGARFHPLEIILSMLIKFAAIAVLGPAVVAVIIFEVILNGMAMFNHGNIGLPLTLDRLLRWLLVTPDMHRIHHSTSADEANSNFGFSLSLWDRLLGTYRSQPRQDHTTMEIGLDNIRDPKRTIHLTGMLMLPFQGDDGRYTINRRDWNNS